MVAMHGAIQDFSVNPDTLEPKIDTIGGAKPRGICGSGLINTIAEMLKTGVIGPDGRFNTNLASKRIREGADGRENVMAWAEDTQIGADIVLQKLTSII
jgi:uncharacterized 2Fe-2S/4Fe-4S cluster protein (DUF4445 family)